ncbi:MAG: hypothetical protein GY774_37990 [Planctomycetes bacterium]|nr:hypothetical protein [Planctomycetota bacterium]
MREDYHKSFKKRVRWEGIKSFLKSEGLGEVYPSYSSSEQDRYVCRPSRENGVHDDVIGGNRLPYSGALLPLQ